MGRCSVRRSGWPAGTGLGALCVTVASGSALAQGARDLPAGPQPDPFSLVAPVTQVARDQHWIHDFLMVVCLLIFVAVFSVMFYSIWKHRKSKGAEPADFHESTSVEIAWTVVPLLIVVAMALPATRMVVDQKDTSNADVTVKATGYQWKWGYDYLKGEGEGISLLSTLATPRDQIENRAPKSDTYLTDVDQPLVVPVNRKIRVITSANDVIHAFFVPALGIKQDAIPGFVRDTWFRAERTGVYRGYCAELCGKDHAFMPIVVEVKSEADYRTWVDGKRREIAAKADDPTKEWQLVELVGRGEKVYAANCAACHQAGGGGVPGAIPGLEGDPVVLGPREAQIQVLLNGKGVGMPSWKTLSDVEIAAVITYTRNSWGNRAQDGIVQPKEISAARR